MAAIEITVHDRNGVVALGALVQCFDAKVVEVVPEQPHPMFKGSKPLKVKAEMSDEAVVMFTLMAKTAGLIEERNNLSWG